MTAKLNEMVQFLPGSTIMANYGLSSKDALEPLMVAISIFLHLLLFKISIRTKKAFYPRTVAILT
jgi:hypothetical protein